MTPEIERVAEAIKDHARGPRINSRERWTECLCGERIAWLDSEGVDDHDWSHTLHVAAHVLSTPD